MARQIEKVVNKIMLTVLPRGVEQMSEEGKINCSVHK